MSQSRKVKILKMDYIEELNLIQWQVQDLETNNIVDMAWRGSDIGTVFGITKEIPPDLIRKFCKDMLGKEINLVMESEADKYGYKRMKELDDDQRIEVMEEWEKKYPFFELEYLEKMKMQQEENEE